VCIASPFSVLVCDLLQRVGHQLLNALDGRGLSPECTLPEGYLRHNLAEHCLEDCLLADTYPGVRQVEGL